MRIATVHQRASLIVGPGAADLYERWAGFVDWAAAATLPDPEPYAPESLGSPSPTPRQMFGIGLNYGAHAAESGFARPETAPPVFTKFPSCITGPYGEVVLPADGHTDWEVELVVVIGRTASHVSAADAWRYIAGLSVGQDLSERVLQMAATPPQFSLGKSYPRFGPAGPWLVTVDDFDDPDDLELGCAINGEQVQKGRTRDLIFGGGRSGRAAVPGDAAAARRPRLHRHAAGRRAGPHPAALACPWRRADQLHRGHRHRFVAGPHR
jgi:2-keto-4-pentenoate hydratase/2-oxohepta-3-ene-1,7-dioic acid hydratase in catechol pathway